MLARIKYSSFKNTIIFLNDIILVGYKQALILKKLRMNIKFINSLLLGDFTPLIFKRI